MTVVHEPRLQLLQFAAHRAPLLGSTPSFCALLFGELLVLRSSLCEARKAVLGSRPSAGTSVEPAAATGSLAGRWQGVPLRVRASRL